MKKYSLILAFQLWALVSAAQLAGLPAPLRTDFDPADSLYGHYLTIVPKGNTPEGALILAAGFGELPEYVFPETKLDSVAYHNNVLIVAFAGGNNLYADSGVRVRLTAVCTDLMRKYKIAPDRFALGGFSAGGAVVLRYTELCHQYPQDFPVKPKAVFMADSPIDIFVIWDQLEQSAKNKYTAIAAEEAGRAMWHIRRDHGAPRENISFYKEVNAFNMDKQLGEPEQYLRNVAVRAYHDVDIPWRLKNRNQTVREGNYFVTSELINRLLLLGNKKAEFIQTYQTGYRSNGQRHPHSWSIVDATDCIQWIRQQWHP
jgi:hypothetical protein